MSIETIHIHKLPDGSLYNAAFDSEVRQHHLLDPGRIVGLGGAAVVKAAVPERSTVNLTLRHCGRSLPIYVKRFVRPPLLRCLVQWLKADPVRSGRDEFNAMVLFQRAGLPGPVPISAGVKKVGLFGQESFLITCALEDTVRLDHLLREQVLSFADRRALIKKLALLVRWMHESGFNHRDLYLCHVLRDRQGGLFFVDLHRVQHRRRVPERWKVKDIAALNYSAPAPLVTRADRLFFLKAYCSCNRLSSSARRFARKVLKKTQKMVQHTCTRKP